MPIPVVPCQYGLIGFVQIPQVALEKSGCKLLKSVIGKGKVKWIYIAPSRETSKVLRHGSHSVTCNYTNACLYLVSVHQMGPPQTEVANI